MLLFALTPQVSMDQMRKPFFVYFVNYTSFGPKAASCLHSVALQDVDVHLGAELHF